MSRVAEIRKAGFRVSWAQGATPEELRDQHRENGWAWEGDTHAHHDGEPIQHHDANVPGYIPEHRVLADDSDQPVILFVEGPMKDGEPGEPTGYEHSDGTPIGPLVQLYVREDDEETWTQLAEVAADLVAELEERASETPDEMAERHAREAEERAAEEA